MKNLHRHRCWTGIWNFCREEIGRVWSRLNLETRNKPWTSKKCLPSLVVKGEFSRGDLNTWTSEARALVEAVLWKTC